MNEVLGQQREVPCSTVSPTPWETAKTLSGYLEAIPAWIVKYYQDGHHQRRPRWQHVQQWLWSPIPDFYNFWQDFTKNQPTEIFWGLWWTKPRKIFSNEATTHRHKLLYVSRVSHSSLQKSEKIFTKRVPPLDPSAHDIQSPKISSPKTVARASMCHLGLATTHGLVLQICANMLRILQNWPYRSLV